MSTGYIYKIISPSRKFYIGRTINLKRRMNEHFNVSLISQEALKYGRENMHVEVLEKIYLKDFRDFGDARYSRDFRYLIDTEKYYIKESADVNMLNILDNPLRT